MKAVTGLLKTLIRLMAVKTRMTVVIRWKGNPDEDVRKDKIIG